MARLGKDIPGFEFNAETWREDDVKQQQLLDDLIAEGKVAQWQRGDGYAMYYVDSEKPLILRHIPIGDAWTIEPELIRGLRLDDVKRNIAGRVYLHELFGGGKQ